MTRHGATTGNDAIIPPENPNIESESDEDGDDDIIELFPNEPTTVYSDQASSNRPTKHTDDNELMNDERNAETSYATSSNAIPEVSEVPHCEESVEGWEKCYEKSFNIG